MNIKTVTVVGANGTMGTNVSAIFASFGNAKVFMVSRDVEKSKKAALKAGKTVKANSIIGCRGLHRFIRPFHHSSCRVLPREREKPVLWRSHVQSPLSADAL